MLNTTIDGGFTLPDNPYLNNTHVGAPFRERAPAPYGGGATFDKQQSPTLSSPEVIRTLESAPDKAALFPENIAALRDGQNRTSMVYRRGTE